MSLVRVWTDVGERKPVALIAKIIEKDGAIFTIKYLSESDDKIWRYEDDTYEIDDDSIAEYLKTDLEEDVGFVLHDDGFIKVDMDDDYIPSSEEDDTDEDDEEDETDADCDEEAEFTEEEDEEENLSD
jgi:hypothetical protein